MADLNCLHAYCTNADHQGHESICNLWLRIEDGTNIIW